MGIETALLFCAIRANEVLGTLSFTRDTRAGYETALCVRKTGYSLSNDLDLCVNAPALLLDATGNPRRFGSVASCFSGAFKPNPDKVRNKDQGRLHPADQ
jgi:hypothetical protein